MDKVLVVSAKCPKDNSVQSAIVEDAKADMTTIRLWCDKCTGYRDFKILTGAFRTKSEADLILKGVI